MNEFASIRPLAMLLALGLAVTSVRAAETGFQADVAVKQPTRLDWDFVASAFGKDAARLPGDYDSSSQRYQLFVPKNYEASKTRPLIVFISPGDDPMGWRAWQKVCEDNDILFCAAYGAGNSCPAGKRIRIVLDMFDDVRRQYRVDPDQTYLAGFSGGGRMACTIAFALPEYFGGVVPVCGTNPLPSLGYLRHRIRDRLSVAFVTGATDFNRRESEDYMFPYFQELAIRSRLWVVPKIGHAIPGADVLGEVQKWLEEDLKRRRADAKDRPGLSASPTEVPTSLTQAKRLLETADEELKQPEHTYRGVALLQGINARWPKTEPAEKARALLKEIGDDAKRLKLIEEQGGAEERLLLGARARSLERFGEMRPALKAWDLLAKNHPHSDEGKKAADEATRLRTALAATPYLGVTFEGQSTTVQAVESKGPADRAGMQPGDKVIKLGDAKPANLVELRRALMAVKPGDTLAVEVLRKGQTVGLTLSVGKTPVD
jgi:pimeloyl-ACP methyl ester carboxylesterase